MKIRWNHTKTKLPENSDKQILVDFAGRYRVIYYFDDSWVNSTTYPRNKYITPKRWVSLEI